MCSVAAVRNDIYGFGLTHLSESEFRIREECLRQTRNHLNIWLKTIRTKDTEWFQQQCKRGKLKSLIRRSGIPSELRPDIWMALSGAKTNKQTYPLNYYHGLLKEAQADRLNEREEIDPETISLFRHNISFGENLDFRPVCRILAAYKKHRPERIRTVNGLASIVAFLLVVIGKEREEDVFWLFDSLIENKLLNNNHRAFGFNCQVQEDVLRALLQKKNPNLHASIVKFGSLSKICNYWFSSLFVLTLPSETAARVWDCLFCEGSKVLLRVAVALMNKNQNTIISMSESSNLPKVLIHKMRRTWDANELLSVAFNSIGSMASNDIDWLGQQAERKLLGQPLLPLTRSWKRLYCGNRK